MNKIQEQLDFTFSFTDFEVITDILEEYLKDRSTAFNKIFSKNYTEKDIAFYIHYFISPFLEEEKYHKNIYRIQHFLNREYEFYNNEKVEIIINELRDIFNVSSDIIKNIDDFEEYEFDTINKIYDLWGELYELVQKYPFLELDKFDYEIKDFVPIYSDPNTDSFVLNEFYKFVDIMKKEFPSSLRRIDSFIFCNPEYIEFVAGEGTMAYFISESVFMPCYIKEEDRNFFIETLYHEFIHYIFELLPETIQILWYDFYDEWEKNNVKMTREEGKNEVEELFADVGSYIYSPVNDFIKEPSKQIIDTFKELIKMGFK